MTPIQQALLKLRKAKSVEEGDNLSDELAVLARKNLAEVIQFYYTTQSDTFALVWCLQSLTDERVRDVCTHALQHKDANVRWAAIEGLKHFTDPALIPVFITALKDRSHMVKGVAVEWLKKNGDTTAIAPLERLSIMPSMIKNSPGTVKLAKEAIAVLRAKT